jgi:hypothetical protein
MKWIGMILKPQTTPVVRPIPLRRAIVKRATLAENVERDQIFKRLSAFPKIQKGRVVG